MHPTSRHSVEERWTTTEAAAYLGVKPSTIRAWQAARPGYFPKPEPWALGEAMHYWYRPLYSRRAIEAWRQDHPSAKADR